MTWNHHTQMYMTRDNFDVVLCVTIIQKIFKCKLWEKSEGGGIGRVLIVMMTGGHFGWLTLPSVLPSYFYWVSQSLNIHNELSIYTTVLYIEGYGIVMYLHSIQYDSMLT